MHDHMSHKKSRTLYDTPTNMLTWRYDMTWYDSLCDSYQHLFQWISESFLEVPVFICRARSLRSFSSRESSFSSPVSIVFHSAGITGITASVHKSSSSAGPPISPFKQSEGIELPIRPIFWAAICLENWTTGSIRTCPRRCTRKSHSFSSRHIRRIELPRQTSVFRTPGVTAESPCEDINSRHLVSSWKKQKQCSTHARMRHRMTWKIGKPIARWDLLFDWNSRANLGPSSFGGAANKQPLVDKRISRNQHFQGASNRARASHLAGSLKRRSSENLGQVREVRVVHRGRICHLSSEGGCFPTSYGVMTNMTNYPRPSLDVAIWQFVRS